MSQSLPNWIVISDRDPTPADSPAPWQHLWITVGESGSPVNISINQGWGWNVGAIGVSQGVDPYPQYLTAAEGDAAYQPLDSDLTEIAALTTTGLIERTGSGTATTHPINALGQTLLNTDAAGARSAIGLGGSGAQLFTEVLSVTGTNTIADLTKTPNATANVILYVNGIAYDTLGGGAADFSVSTKSITWSAANAGFSVVVGDRVLAQYTTLE